MMERKIAKWALVLGLGLVFLLGMNQISFATEVRIWDNDTTSWTTTFANGDPIDTGTANTAYSSPQLAIDSNGIAYVTYYQRDGLWYYIYLSRYDGTDVRIWDNDTTGWTTTFANGDPIDTGNNSDDDLSHLAIDSNDRVYFTYTQYNGVNNHIYLSRYDGTDVRIWDNNTTNWTTTFADGDPIDTGTANDAHKPKLAIDSDGIVYVTYYQSDGVSNRIYLSRYDGTDVRIWDNDTTGWTTTFANGDPIDPGTATGAVNPQLAIDSNGIVYIAYVQSDGTNIHVYLNCYDGTDVRIWDNATGWTTTFADGDPIDTGTTNDAYKPRLAIDSNDRVYVAYAQTHGTNYHIYMSRYDGTDVRIWDNGIKNWTTIFANGDPIDTGTSNQAWEPQLAIDSNDIVYVTFRQNIGIYNHIYLSRYDGIDVRIWDNDATGWTTTFANGDPIDTGYGAPVVEEPQLAIDSNDIVYVTYYQSDGTNYHIYLNRYDGTDVRIWDNTTGWTTTFANGDPIDTGLSGPAYSALHPQLAIDSNDRVYVTFRQVDGTHPHIYLSRYVTSASKLAFTVQPSNTLIGETITPAVKIATQDQYGTTVTSDNSTQVTVAIQNNPSGGILSGTLSKIVSSGVATFDDLSIDKAGTDYTLQATASGLTSATSNAFDITSTGGGGGGGGGCFISTAAYGSPMASYVKLLREFRDRFLLTNSLGKAFMELYYTYSPHVAELISKNNALRAI